MRNWVKAPSDVLGYAIRDFSGGIPELLIGSLPEIWQYAVYTLVGGLSQVVFEGEEGPWTTWGTEHFAILQAPGRDGNVSLSLKDTQIFRESFYFTLYGTFGDASVSVCHNITGSLDPAGSELTGWGKEYFYAWEPEYVDWSMIQFLAD